MNQPSRWRATLLLVLTFVIGVGSIVVFAAVPLGSLRVIRPAWPEAAILAWNAALSLLFFLQHSGMIRRPVRARLGRVVPPAYVPALYAIASGLALFLVVLLWQPSPTHLYSLGGVARVAAYALALAGFALFVWGWRTLKSFDPLGLRPLRATAPTPLSSDGEFAARGAYGLVRHPLYLAVILLLWSTPEVTADRMLFDVLWTAWIVLGTMLEEADLVAEFGESYRVYQRAVPMLIPWIKPRRSH